MKLTIQVTEQDIQNGEPENGDSCPIALAMKRQGCEEVHVTSYDVTILLPDIERRRNVPLPQAAKDFVKNFDLTIPEDRHIPEPFTFEIELP